MTLADNKEIAVLNGNDWMTPEFWETATATEIARRCRQGQCVFSKDNQGKTVLHWAAAHGTESAVKSLLDAGAEVDAQDVYGCTPLHWAGAYGVAENVKLLLDAGADIDARNEHKRTPLHETVMEKENGTEALYALLHNHPDLDARDNTGRTPLDLADDLHNYEAVNALAMAPVHARRRALAQGNSASKDISSRN